MGQRPASDQTDGPIKTDTLAVFTFLWACQALVHQEFYQLWLPAGNPLGWLVTIFGMAALLFPRRALFLVLLCASSVVYNVCKWPFVVNHILLESIANFVILVSVVTTRLGLREDSTAQRAAAIDRFAPALKWSMIIMYYFAFVAKLNHDFFDPEISCVSFMYERLVDRFPFLPNTSVARRFFVWATLVVELAIPVLFTFRKTWGLAILIGMPFHFVLGLVGHRTFSAIAVALYCLFIIVPLTASLNGWLNSTRRRIGDSACQSGWIIIRVAASLVVAALLGSRILGHYESGIGPLKFFRVAWGIWILWSLLLMAVVAWTIWSGPNRWSLDRAVSPRKWKWTWAVLAIVFLNGSSQYLGLKTETCFTMYSNLRTEGGVNNHLFLPSLRLTNYQDDLVEVTEVSSAPEKTERPRLHHVMQSLNDSIERGQYVTRFELQRAAQMSRAAVVPFHVRYIDGTVEKSYRSDSPDDSELSEDHSIWLFKLLWFRPVDKDGRMRCQH